VSGLQRIEQVLTWRADHEQPAELHLGLIVHLSWNERQLGIASCT